MADTDSPAPDDLARLPLDERAKELTELVTELERRLEATSEPDKD